MDPPLAFSEHQAVLEALVGIVQPDLVLHAAGLGAELDFIDAFLQAHGAAVARISAAHVRMGDDARRGMAARGGILAPLRDAVVVTRMAVAVTQCHHRPRAARAQVADHFARHRAAGAGVGDHQAFVDFHDEGLPLAFEQPDVFRDGFNSRAVV